jgi:hypothetical protein
MRSFRLLSATALLATAGSVMASSVDPIVIKGSKFFYQNNGTQL